MAAPPLQSPRADRRRPDRRLDRARRACARHRARNRCDVALRADAAAHPRTGARRRVVDSSAAAVADADLVIVCVPIGACGAVAKEIGPHLKPGAIVSDVGSVKGAVVRDMAPHIPAGVHFIPGHPVAGTENSGPDAASPSCSSTAGASSRRRRTPMRARSSGWRNSGRRSAPASKSCRRSITTWCWRSPATCRISSPTTSWARRSTCVASPSRKSSNTPPAGSAISPGSRRPTQPCGAIFS